MYFLLFPMGFFLGTLVSGRLSQRVSLETMVLAGSVIHALAVASQSASILAGYLTPLVIFVPGFFITFGQGMALPNAQVGAIRVIPALAGTAAGIGVFCQNFLGAVFAQIYTLIADGTPLPMVVTVVAGSVLTLAAGVTPFILKHRRRASHADR
jgi:DHA1 family bicyclomycin/chloramphenicol resistance-like MFS transporter